uniref:D-beta-hydroxybutyrate dehydrogenase, mitochondrial-like isoform X2 n=1 Tax=Crassostrea virginica TaxID=6565 RepID=A0A8B8DRU5_CRAVI|nr:D-beta-hydroxybutyrate dehydrogenase, mitochondrial-like isoform X2 [Crassostrea virginica]
MACCQPLQPLANVDPTIYCYLGTTCTCISSTLSGFGHELVKRLDQLGFTVFAGCLSEKSEGAQNLQKECTRRVHILKLDVTKSEDIRRAADTVEKICRGTGLWALVNNAGIDSFGDVEFCTMEMYRRVADVNLFGLIHVTKALLPLIRKCKGRVVNVTSVKGILSRPTISVYGNTKFGAENFSDCLRLEMRKFGVKVSIVEPGNFGGLTGIVRDQNLERLMSEMEKMWESADEEVQEAYGREHLEEQFTGLHKASQNCAPNMGPVLRALEDALTSETPAIRYLVDGGRGLIDWYNLFGRMNYYLPTEWMDFIIDKAWNFGIR